MQQNFSIQRERQVRGTIYRSAGEHSGSPANLLGVVSERICGTRSSLGVLGGRFGSSGRNSRFRKLGNAELGIDTLAAAQLGQKLMQRDGASSQASSAAGWRALILP